MPIDAEVPRSPVIQIAPPLDEVGAAAMLRALARMPKDAAVVLDFHRVEPLDDVVVARVVRAVRHSRPGPFTTVGLSLHHERLLRHLGLAPEPPPDPAPADSSDLVAVDT